MSSSSENVTADKNTVMPLAAERPDSIDQAAEKGGYVETPVALDWGSDIPDGGVAAWLVVLGGWCTSFCSFGWINSECARPGS